MACDFELIASTCGLPAPVVTVAPVIIAPPPADPIPVVDQVAAVVDENLSDENLMAELVPEKKTNWLLYAAIGLGLLYLSDDK